MAKFMLFCAIAGLVLNAVITYCSSDSYSYDDYYESDEYYESEGNSSYESPEFKQTMQQCRIHC